MYAVVTCYEGFQSLPWKQSFYPMYRELLEGSQLMDENGSELGCSKVGC